LEARDDVDVDAKRDDEARRLPGAPAGARGAAARAARDMAGSGTTAPRGDGGGPRGRE
jgi:hypothetical protein